MKKSKILEEKNIKLKVSVSSKEEAIKEVGLVLVENGYVEPEYLHSMENREEIVSTYLGNYVAIPHGEEGSGDLILKPGISLVTLKEDVYFDENEENPVKVLFGIASDSEDHLDILSKIAIYVSEVENVIKLSKMEDKNEILEELEAINL